VRSVLPGLIAVAALGACKTTDPISLPEGPLARAVDLEIGEEAWLDLWNGQKTHIKLIALDEATYGTTSVVREAKVTIEVDGNRAELVSALYRLPSNVGAMQVDCPITRGYVKTSKTNAWALDKAARLRVWPGGTPWIGGGFGYPVRQRWFATDTQMGNEPCYVNEVEPFTGKIYYHYGLDIGGQEGKVEVISASDGVVVAAGKESLPGHEAVLATPRRDFIRDTVYICDEKVGSYYRYSHLQTIHVKPGQLVKLGDGVGLLGKEGDSGGWSHLHFDITRRQPSGRWGIEDGYAFLWQAYRRQHHPAIIAVARPHGATTVGERITLDGTRSWVTTGTSIDLWEWTLSDGSTAAGGKVERVYDRPGTYSEVLKVVDTAGRAAYDFAVVQVSPRGDPKLKIPAIHTTYFPTLGLKPGHEVTFQVRTFDTTDGNEIWDFGDGSARVEVKSDGNADHWAKDGYASTTHRFDKPGDYVVRVERANRDGLRAVGHVVVTVER
jgi:hypothetical protein